MTESPEDCVYSLIERAAIEGRRCATNSEIAAHLRKHGFRANSASSIPNIMRRLTRHGRIIVRIYGHNWRDVVICEGPHADKSTMPPKHGGRPHTIIDLAERAKRDAHKWHH